MSRNVDTDWGDVAGLENIKKALKEIIILPFLRPYVSYSFFKNYLISDILLLFIFSFPC